jgi:hypothetical protein
LYRSPFFFFFFFLSGDAYLKYLSSVYVFVTNPSQHEGALHSARLRIISNRALLLNGDNARLPPFIQAKAFVAKIWQPPNFYVHPPPPRKKGQEEDPAVDGGKEQAIDDKQVLDKESSPVEGQAEEVEKEEGEIIDVEKVADNQPLESLAIAYQPADELVVVKVEPQPAPLLTDVQPFPAEGDQAVHLDPAEKEGVAEIVDVQDGEKKDKVRDGKKENTQAGEKKTGKRPKKRRAQDSRGMNWLGDKVFP